MSFVNFGVSRGFDASALAVGLVADLDRLGFSLDASAWAFGLLLRTMGFGFRLWLLVFVISIGLACRLKLGLVMASMGLASMGYPSWTDSRGSLMGFRRWACYGVDGPSLVDDRGVDGLPSMRLPSMGVDVASVDGLVMASMGCYSR